MKIEEETWYPEGAAKPTIEYIDYDREKRINYEQDQIMNRKLTKSVRLSDGFISEIDNVITTAKIELHLHE